MQFYKPAAVVCLGHATETVTDSEQPLSDIPAGARSVLLVNVDSLGSAVWVSMDGEAAAVDRGVRLTERDRIELTLENLASIRVVAPENESCKLSVSYFR